MTARKPVALTAAVAATIDRWKPRRMRLRGRALYCSPACGAGCTQHAFARATLEATTLCTRMGTGWQPDVWENMGWYWCINKGMAQIRPEYARKPYDPRAGQWKVTGYSAEIFIAGGRQWFSETWKNPKNALAEAITLANKHARDIERAVDKVMGSA